MGNRVKNLFVFGTRPEAIKMAPVITAFQSRSDVFENRICVTGQHRLMLDQVLDFFKIVPDYDLNIMRSDQSLNSITSTIITELDAIYNDYCPANVFVHGDTTTAMAAGLSAFYRSINVSHVEAGLRTYNNKSPFPEELNRQITGRLAEFHFAPTELSKINLLNEGIDAKKICVTGNTVIDALFDGLEYLKDFKSEEICNLKTNINFDKKIILVTGHRRENHGGGFDRICKALNLLSSHPDVHIVYPVHLNPNVQSTVFSSLQDNKNISLIAPLSYPAFLWLMSRANIILTDSGGIQEEAPSLGVPVLVMRETTERPEAVEAGTVKLVGSDVDLIVKTGLQLINEEGIFLEMSKAHNPYGDGKAAQRILEFMLKNHNLC